MSFVFSSQRIREMKQQPGRLYGTIVTPSFSLPRLSVGEKCIRNYYREIQELDGDGKTTGQSRKELVQTAASDGALRPAKLTVLMIEMMEVYATTATYPIRVMDELVAQACGYKTVAVARAIWEIQHPRSPLAKLIWFMLGDQRDQDRYLRRYVWRGGDYTKGGEDIIDNLPALTEAQLRELATHNNQRDFKRRADTASILAGQSLAQRVARIENAGAEIQAEVHCELRIMTDRTARGIRKLNAA